MNNKRISQWVTTAHVTIIEGCSFNAEWRKLIIWYPRKKKNEHAIIDLVTTLQQFIRLFCTVLVPKKLHIFKYFWKSLPGVQQRPNLAIECNLM